MRKLRDEFQGTGIRREHIGRRLHLTTYIGRIERLIRHADEDKMSEVNNTTLFRQRKRKSGSAQPSSYRGHSDAYAGS